MEEPQPYLCRKIGSRFWPAGKLLTLALLTALAPQAKAAAPPNDVCSTAQVVPGSGPFPYLTTIVDLSNATTLGDPPAPSCPFDPPSRSVWYRFTPATTDTYRISTCPEAGAGTTVPDTVLAIYRSSNGTCSGTFTEVTGGCADDTCGTQSEIVTPMAAGQTYFILVWRYYDESPPSSGEGFVQVLVERAAVMNDVCATPEEVQLNVPVTGTTVLATDDYRVSPDAPFPGVGQTPVSSSGREVVFTFTAPTAGNYNLRVRNYNYSPAGAPPGYDLVLYATAECPVGSFPIIVTNCIAAANRNSSGISEEINCLRLAASQKIYIFVDDQISTNRGTTFQLEVTRCWPEYEPNSPRTNANAFFYDLSGNIDPIGDVDFVALGTFPEGYRVFALLDSSAANQSAFQMRLVTTTNTLEFDDRDNDLPFGALSPNLAGTPLVGGPAYLRLTLAPNSLSALGPYRLFGVVQPPQETATTETEPNDGFLRANRAANNYFYGTLPGPGRSSDVDVFAFSVQAGDMIFLSLDGDPLRDNTPLDAALELLNEAGSVVLQVDDPNWLSSTNRFSSGFVSESPQSPGEGLVYRAPHAGTYYARVSTPASPIAAGSGDYLLSIARNCFAGPGTNTPPRVNNLTVPAVPEGSTVSLSGTVHDPDAGPKFRVVIDWGDGSVRETNALAVGEYDFQATHRYPFDNRAGAISDTYPLSITVVDNYGLGALTPGSVVVSNLAPALTDVEVTSPINSGSTATLTGNVADANPFDALRLVVNWGGGSALETNSLPMGSTSFTLLHTYNPGRTTNYNITVALQDDDGGSASASAIVDVRAATSATFQSIKHSGSSVQITLQGTPGATYTVLVSENLKDWRVFGPAIADSQGNIQFQDPAPTPNWRFYRAVWP